MTVIFTIYHKTTIFKRVFFSIFQTTTLFKRVLFSIFQTTTIFKIVLLLILSTSTLFKRVLILILSTTTLFKRALILILSTTPLSKKVLLKIVLFLAKKCGNLCQFFLLWVSKLQREFDLYKLHYEYVELSHSVIALLLLKILIKEMIKNLGIDSEKLKLLRRLAPFAVSVGIKNVVTN